MYTALENKIIVKRNLPKEETTESGIIIAPEDNDSLLEFVVLSAEVKELEGKTVVVERPRAKKLNSEDGIEYCSVEQEYILAIKN